MKIFAFLLSFAWLSIAQASVDFQYFDNDGVKIAYRIFGEGRPLYLLNGGPGRSSDTFTELAETLQKKTQRQIVLFDQRGTGRSKLSKTDESTVTLALMISDLEALRKHLGHESISILGHSFGGMYAMAYAAQFPDRVGLLVLSCSGGLDVSWHDYVHHNMLSRLNAKARARYAYWTRPEQTAKNPKRAAREAMRLLIPSYIFDQKFVPQLERDLLDPRFQAEGVNELVWKSMHAYDLKNSLKVFGGRALIIGGRQDILGEAIPLAIGNAIAKSQVEFIDQCAHYPWLDQPAKYFSLIVDFLSAG